VDIDGIEKSGKGCEVDRTDSTKKRTDDISTITARRPHEHQLACILGYIYFRTHWKFWLIRSKLELASA